MSKGVAPLQITVDLDVHQSPELLCVNLEAQPGIVCAVMGVGYSKCTLMFSRDDAWALCAELTAVLTKTEPQS